GSDVCSSGLRLPEPARLVFFQHDEVMVHCPAELCREAVAAVEESALEATRLLFGATPVRLPMHATPVLPYANAEKPDSRVLLRGTGGIRRSGRESVLT